MLKKKKGNEISSIPELRETKDNLKTLSLKTNKFTTAPAQLGQLEALESLDMSNNVITSISDAIGSCMALRKLNFSCEKPVTFMFMYRLYYYCYYYPSLIGALPLLYFFVPSANQLSILCGGLFRLSHLVTLDLSANQLTTVRESLPG